MGDVDALWGYAAAKFSSRARMAFNAFTHKALSRLRELFAQRHVRVAAFGGGPAAELFAAVVARDIAGGAATSSRFAVFEWVPDWSPVVEGVAQLLEEPIEYHHCDVTKPLADTENAALWASDMIFDLAIFSHVLLECGRGEVHHSSGSASLTLLRDLWIERPTIEHFLILDAGQAKGKDQRARPLAGSLRAVEMLANELEAPLEYVRGWKRTDGVLL